MKNAPKIIVLFLSLALVAGLFVLLNRDETEENGSTFPEFETKKEVSKEETPEIEVKTEKKEEIREASFKKTIPEEPSLGWSQEKLAEEIHSTVSVFEENGHVVVSYAQPNIPKKYHFTFKAEIFDQNGKTIDRYVSDAGWLSDSSFYDPSEKIKEIQMKVTDLTNKMAIILVKVGDESMLKSANVYQLIIGYDGSYTWESAYIE